MSLILLRFARPQCLAATHLSSPEVGNGLSWPKPQCTCNAMVAVYTWLHYYYYSAGIDKTVDIVCSDDGCSSNINECQPIVIPKNDSDFIGKRCLEFVRSQSVPNINCTMGDAIFVPNEFTGNAITRIKSFKN